MFFNIFFLNSNIFKKLFLKRKNWKILTYLLFWRSKIYVSDAFKKKEKHLKKNVNIIFDKYFINNTLKIYTLKLKISMYNNIEG